ncbi:hypothetical protein BR10RB9215_C10621 [Brucella sp. 10RB9215]|nr:hypothetical protein BR10RB9215_C10621 [Brucella sp. 10RB9215]
MYDWAKKRKYVSSNPAKGIDKIYVKGDGATPWKAVDVKKFFAKHKPGSKAHVAMSVLLWTGCRVEDLTVLGRSHECVIDGVDAVRWQPSKKGSTEVTVPLLPALRAATRAPKVQGATYVLGRGVNLLQAVTACRQCSSGGAKMPSFRFCPRTASVKGLLNYWRNKGAANTKSWPFSDTRRLKLQRSTHGALSVGSSRLEPWNE